MTFAPVRQQDGLGHGLVAVHQQKAGPALEAGHGAAHGFEGGLQDVDAVDGGGPDHAQPPGQGALADQGRQMFPLGGAQGLGIREARQVVFFRQDDGRRHDGTGQTAAARLIDARHEQGTGGQGAEQALFRGRCGGGSFAARGHRVSLGC